MSLAALFMPSPITIKATGCKDASNRLTAASRFLMRDKGSPGDVYPSAFESSIICWVTMPCVSAKSEDEVVALAGSVAGSGARADATAKEEAEAEVEVEAEVEAEAEACTTAAAAAAAPSCLASISAIAIEGPARLTACTPFGPSAACFITAKPFCIALEDGGIVHISFASSSPLETSSMVPPLPTGNASRGAGGGRGAARGTPSWMTKGCSAGWSYCAK